MDIRYIGVTAANLWEDPNKVRELDEPSLTVPVHLEKWLETMSRDDRLDLLGRLDSQILFGESVICLEERDGWARVLIPSQYTPKDQRGYPGWISVKQLFHNPDYHQAMKQNPLAYVTAKKSQITFSDGKRTLDVSFMTKLPCLEEKDGRVTVALPFGGVGHLPKSDVTVAWKLPVTDAAHRISIAKRYEGLPYLWAGMSSWGFDCSGYVYRIFEAGGMMIPRDASIQARFGQKVSRNELQPGDLVFFAYEEGKGAIHHVGMYIGENRFIHSPNTGNPVKINNMTDDPYHQEFCWGCRYNGSESFPEP